MEALMIWSVIHFTTSYLQKWEFCRSCEKAAPCVFGKQYSSLCLIPRAPGNGAEINNK